MFRCLVAIAVASLALVAACSAQFQSAHAQTAQPPAGQSAEALPEAREAQARQDVQSRVDSLVERADFEALDALVTASRSSDQLTPAGVPVAHLVYEEVGNLVSAAEHDTGCASPLASRIAAWAAANAASPTAINVNAIALKNHAWCYRGSEFADKVPGQDWAPFERYIQTTRAWLDAHRGAGQADPQWYVNMENVALAQGWNSDEFLALVRAGSDRFPGYFRIYELGMTYFSPRWYGDYVKLETFAKMAADRAGATDGKALYARLYWYVFDEQQLDNLKTQSNVNWDLMVQGMDALTRQHPDAWNSFAMARLACAGGDHELMMRYLRQVFPYLEGYGDPGAPEVCDGLPKAPPSGATDDCDLCKGR